MGRSAYGWGRGAAQILRCARAWRGSCASGTNNHKMLWSTIRKTTVLRILRRYTLRCKSDAVTRPAVIDRYMDGCNAWHYRACCRGQGALAHLRSAHAISAHTNTRETKTACDRMYRGRFAYIRIYTHADRRSDSLKQWVHCATMILPKGEAESRTPKQKYKPTRHRRTRTCVKKHRQCRTSH